MTFYNMLIEHFFTLFGLVKKWVDESFSRIKYQKLKKKVKNPLKGMKIMPYYGCMLLRPREVAIDDAEEPTIMSDLLKTLGAEVIDNPFKIECCGSYHTIEEKKLVSDRAYKITNYAIDRGSDAIMLSFPLTSILNLHNGQDSIIASLPRSIA